MIDALKDNEIIERVGGRFRLTALIQRRLVELMQGARPMVEAKGLTEMEVVVREIMEGKIEAYMPDEGSESDEEHELDL
jgi:DNA-directed RNA polymerase subunit omega